MNVSLSKSKCALSEQELTLSSGVDVRGVSAIGISLPPAACRLKRAFVLVPMDVGAQGQALESGLTWCPAEALDLADAAHGAGFESLDVSKLVAHRLAYVAADGAPLVFAVRKAA